MFVVTAQIMMDLLNHALVKLEEVALLIMDECHHVIGENHVYRQLMNEYRKCSGGFYLYAG